MLDSNSLSQLEALFRDREKGVGKVGGAGVSSLKFLCVSSQ